MKKKLFFGTLIGAVVGVGIYKLVKYLQDEDWSEFEDFDEDEFFDYEEEDEGLFDFSEKLDNQEKKMQDIEAKVPVAETKGESPVVEEEVKEDNKEEVKEEQDEEQNLNVETSDVVETIKKLEDGELEETENK